MTNCWEILMHFLTRAGHRTRIWCSAQRTSAPSGGEFRTPHLRSIFGIWCSAPSIPLLRTIKSKIKSSLYSPYYAEACNELRGPSPRLSAWATQLRRDVATVASRWRHCVDLTGPGIESQTSRTDSVRLATELTAGTLRTII